MKLIGSVRILQTDRVSVRLPALDRRVGQLLPRLQYRYLLPARNDVAHAAFKSYVRAAPDARVFPVS